MTSRTHIKSVQPTLMDFHTQSSSAATSIDSKPCQQNKSSFSTSILKNLKIVSLSWLTLLRRSNLPRRPSSCTKVLFKMEAIQAIQASKTSTVWLYNTSTWGTCSRNMQSSCACPKPSKTIRTSVVKIWMKLSSGLRLDNISRRPILTLNPWST